MESVVMMGDFTPSNHGFILPPSPNWYCSSVLDISTVGLVAYGARSDVVLLQTAFENAAIHSSLGRATIVKSDILPKCHRDRTTFVKHSSTGFLFTGGEDGKVKFWKLLNRKCENEHQEHGKVKVTCGTLFGHSVVISGDEKGFIVCWNLEASRINTAKLGNSSVFSMSCDQMRQLCAVGLKSGGIYLYDVQSHQVVKQLKGHDEEIHSLSWKPGALTDETSVLLSGSRDKTLRVWDISSGRTTYQSRLPGTAGGGSRQNRERIWISTCWLQSGKIISSTPGGDFLSWTQGNKGSLQYAALPPEGSKKHHRIVFSMDCWPEKNVMISTSMDRSIIIWDTSPSEAPETEALGSGLESWRNNRNSELESSDCSPTWRKITNENNAEQISPCRPLLLLPTLGGYAYCVRASLIDPGRLAIGVGDNLIRLWNVNEGAEDYSITSVWQGLKSKVTAIAWHPQMEWLAYGTDDGRVGIFQALTKKSPIISSTYHQKMVYVISWGPPVLSEKSDAKSFNVYSVGDGTVNIHNMSKADQQAKDLNKMITEANPSVQAKTRSELTWLPDYALMLLGSDDGTVLILQRTDLKLICTVKVCSKLVNALRLQPQGYLLAIGSNEHSIQIVDLTQLLRGNRSDWSTPVISDSIVVLKGHKSRVTDLCWNTNPNSYLLSVSYDGSAMVWDVKTGVALSQYKTQAGHLLTCQWSLLDSDLVYTGSDDFSLHSWRPSEHKKLIKSADTSQPNKSDSTHQAGSDDVMQLIEEKKAELRQKEADSEEITYHIDSQNLTSVVNGDESTRKQATMKKARRAGSKSFFPNMAAANKQSKNNEIADLIHLQRCITEKTNVCSEERQHLGIFSPKQADFEAFIGQEKSALHNDGSHDSVYHMMIWQGDVAEALQSAAENKRLSDWLVNAASMLSFEAWLKYCQLFARQLKDEGQIQKAVLYLLYTHEVDGAIDWLVEAKLFREALCIARSRYPPASDKTTQLYKHWLTQIRKDANYDMAAKCCVTLNDPSSAMSILNRRQDCIESVMNAVKFGVTVPSCHVDMHPIAENLTKQCLISGQYDQLIELCENHVELQVYKGWCIVYKELGQTLLTGKPESYAVGEVLHHFKMKLETNDVDVTRCLRQTPVPQSYIDQTQIRIAVVERIMHAVCIMSDETVEATSRTLLQACMILISNGWSEGTDKQLMLAEQTAALYHKDIDLWKLISGHSTDTMSLRELALPICYIWAALTRTIWQKNIISTTGNKEFENNSNNHTAILSGTSSANLQGEIENSSSVESFAINSPTTSCRNGDVVSNEDITKTCSCGDALSFCCHNLYDIALFLCSSATVHGLDSDSVGAIRNHCRDMREAADPQELLNIYQQLTMNSLFSAADIHNESLDGQTSKYVTILLMDTLRKLSGLSAIIKIAPSDAALPALWKLVDEWMELFSPLEDESEYPPS